MDYCLRANKPRQLGTFPCSLAGSPSDRQSLGIWCMAGESKPFKVVASGTRSLATLLTVLIGIDSSCGADASLLAVQSALPTLPARFVNVSGASPTAVSPVLIQTTVSNVTVFGLQPDAQLGSALAAFRLRAGEQTVMLAIGARRYVPEPSRPPTGGVILLEAGGVDPARWRSVVVASARRNSLFGHSLANAGDVDGDGFGDLLVGSPRYTSSRYWEGAWYLYRGSQVWTSTNQSWNGSGAGWANQTGSSVASAGDVNGDGLADFIVGAPGEARTTFDLGAAMLFLGTSNNASEPVRQWAIQGDQIGARFGSAVASAGDVNRDGFADVLVGAPRYSGTLSNAGRVYLYLGGSNGLSRTPAWTADGPAASAGFGSALSPVGDVNQDGFADVIIGAPGLQRGPAKWPGSAYLYHGTRSGLEKSPIIKFVGHEAGSHFGATFATGGDVNGDGVPDLLIGAPGHGPGKIEEGRVHLFLGRSNGFNPLKSWIVDGGEAGAACGSSLTMVPDINGDGCDEFMVGTPRHKFAKRDEGRADLFYGSRTNFVEREYHKDEALQTNANGRRVILPLLFGGLFAILAGWWFKHDSLKGRVTAAKIERKRLARDLHDGLGGKFTRISTLSELVRRHASNPQEAQRYVSELAETAREVLDSMETIIWTVNPDQDSLENLVMFMVQYAQPFFAPTSIKLRCSLPETVPTIQLEQNVRNNLFLTLKESLTNVLKHSGAQNVKLIVTCESHVLKIMVEDDGQAVIVGEIQPTSDGLKNMAERMKEIGGSFSFEKTEGSGSRTVFTLNLR